LAKLSKDELAFFDPDIKDVSVRHDMIYLLLHQGTVVLSFKEQELDRLIRLLQETKNGL
jgi:hypothetical protein